MKIFNDNIEIKLFAVESMHDSLISIFIDTKVSKYIKKTSSIEVIIMVKEINSLLNLYLEINEEILVEGKECGLRNLRTGEEDNGCNIVHDFLYELLSSNPEILKKYGFKEWSFNVHESKIEEIED